MCYYAVSADFPVVESISIVRKKAGQPDYTYTECNNILQPIEKSTSRIHSVSLNVLDTLLKETPKGQTLRIAMSYWIKGVASDACIISLTISGGHLTGFLCMRVIIPMKTSA